MKFKQQLIIVRSRAISSEDRPVPYIGKLPSYTGENQNLRNTSNMFREQIHSSHSDPLNDPFRFLKKRNNQPRFTQDSSDELKIKEKIDKLEIQLEQVKAIWNELYKKYVKYQNSSLQASLKGDKQMANYFLHLMQSSTKQRQEQGKMMKQFNTEIRELKRQLQKLQARKI